MPIYKMDGKKDGLQKYRVAYSYTDKSGKYKQVFRVAYGKEEAKLREAELAEEYGSGNAADRMTVNDLAEKYLSAKAQDVRATTLAKSRQVLHTHILPRIGEMRLSRLSVQTLGDWKLEVGKLELALTMKRNIFKELNTMLNWAVRFEYIPSNPMRQLGTFKEVYFEKPAEVLHYYTADQFRDFIAAARTDAEAKNDWRYYTFFMIAFFGGLRKGEINALKWSDIEGNTIHVRRSIAQKLKGDDVETPPKNKSSYRDLQMPHQLAIALHAERNRQMSESGFKEDWRVCGGPSVLRDTSIENKNKAYTAAAGLPHIRIHDFRHSHASLLVNEGISIQEVARRLGHSKVEITWNTYAHLYPREEERAISVLDKVAL